ncbi:amino acid transporter [Chelonobacter oris]|uniref:Amino acid transporter n=1 Tax=Chelonobacter oris TaxID=505317 RepID=A0A0A3AP20_9PAST|nr:EamA family transporter [Chelonobacter oris]KGQ71096.1 amino acid transporter [Chelonobacter oris]MDH3000698.1 amino acid transporter [Chelonobacter oris]
MLIQDKIAAFIVIFIWGINFYFMKLAVAEVDPMLLGFLRFSMVLLPAIFFIKKPNIKWKWLLLYGFIGNFAQFAFMFSAIALDLPTSLASLVVQSQAFFSVLIAAFVLGERARKNEWIAMIIAAVGLLLIALGQTYSHVPLIGLLMVLGSALSWAIGNIIVKKIGKTHPLGLVLWGNLLTPFWFLLFSLYQHGAPHVASSLQLLSWKGWLSSAFLAYFATLIGYGLWVYLLAKYSAGKITPLSLWVPVVSMIFAFLLLHETLNSWQLSGSAVIMLGLFIHLFGQKIAFFKTNRPLDTHKKG